MNFLAAYIMKGRMQAMIVASSLALLSLVLPPASIVSSASVALVTLRRGGYEGFYVLICACLSAALLGFFLFGSFQFALLYGLMLWLPIWFISIVLRRNKHLSVAIEIAVIIGIIAVIGFYVYVSDPALMWQAVLEGMVKPMLANDSDMPVDDIKQSIQIFSHYMTGGITAGAIYGLLFGLFLARMWQAALYNPGGFREEYLTLKVRPKVALVSVFVLMMAWFMSGDIAEIFWNITIIFIVLYTFIGTAILHAAFSTLKMKRFLVPMLYVTLIMIPHAIAVVIIVGITDVWVDLRSKFSNKVRTE
ncbi:MAG: hypothetical protein HFP77_07925 [Methylococcales symbiont of Iophon sp. n. MRB-2018]|nr:MAG: hypothetical protein HFP77_07925 [Methylococcales symbiont of Iophon sp. n. MRB-2018]KAF3979199.1 MAG: hypothetical protein HFP76_08895 [Methylococcales symbiont of Iophon sp. n. MRB-2018]